MHREVSSAATMHTHTTCIRSVTEKVIDAAEATIVVVVVAVVVVVVAGVVVVVAGTTERRPRTTAVSYTHLTLPTIYSV